MYHSVNFGDKNSYDDWHLVPDGRPVIAMPEVKTNTIEVPGASGVIDISELLTNYPLYNNRTGDLKFHVLNDYGEWQERYQEIANYVHGKVIRLSLEDDPNYYYKGRISLSQWDSKNDGTWSEISFSYELDPYKYRLNPTTYTVNSTNSTTRLSIPVNDIGRMPTIPTFNVSNVGSNGILVVTNNPELKIINQNDMLRRNGENIAYDIVLSNVSGSNTNELRFTGSGRVVVTIQAGDL